MLPRLLAPDRPDWRWTRAVELAQYSNTQAAVRLQSEDPGVRRAFGYKRALDRGTPEDFGPEHAAHYLYTSDPRRRYFIEGLILGREGSDERIAEFAGVPISDIILAYHDLFFAIRPFLDSPGWIAAAVFDGMPYRTHPGDIRGIHHRLAWLLGHNAFRQLVNGRVDFDSRSEFNAVIADVLRSNVLELSLTVAARHESPDWLRAFTELANKEMDAEVGGDSSFEEAAGQFLDSLGISVADPTDASNLELPAREPRAITTSPEVVHE